MEWVFIAMCLLCWFLDFDGVCVWLIAIFLPMIWLKKRLSRFYGQIIDDYPCNKCVVPKVLKRIFLFTNKHPGKDLPEDIYILGIIQYASLVIGTIIGSILLLVILPFNELLVIEIGAMYLLTLVLIDIFFIFRATKRAFYARYKIMNRYNFYRISGTGGAEPSEKYIGKCIILREYKKRGRIFVTVQMQEGGEIVERVLLSSIKKTGENPSYCLYEICKVKFIT